MLRSVAATIALFGLSCVLAQGGEPSVLREDWNWVEAMRTVAAKGKGVNRVGVVLTLGDSLSYANQSTKWAKYGKGHTPEDKAVLKWSHAFEKKSDSNGWWLAAVDRPGGRSETAASGIRTDQYIRGGFHGLPSLKDILGKYKPQVAFVMLGTNDACAKRKPEDVAKNMGIILDTIMAAGTVPVLQFCPPIRKDARHAIVKKYNKLYLELARKKKVPIIDLYGEFLTRAPDGGWKTQLMSRDGIHFTPKLSAGPPTDHNLARCGYLLRCWLAVQKLKKIKSKVLEGAADPGKAKATTGSDAAAPEDPASIATPTGPPSETWFPKAPPLPKPAGQVLKAASVDELVKAVAQVKPGGTILVAPGRYDMKRCLFLRTSKITLRGATGKRDDVVFDGGGTLGEIVGFSGCSDVTVADLTIQNVRHNGFKINAVTGVHRIRLYNCVAHNIWQRAVKSGGSGKVGANPKLRPVGCRIQYCLFYNDRPKRFSDDPDDKPGKFDGNYIGGIDAMFAQKWVISDNVFVGIRGRTGSARGAIFLWHEVGDCVIERNVFIDCDSGICLGNAYFPEERHLKAHARRCIVRNNFITRAHEKGIEAVYTEDCKVLHNTVHDPQNRMRRLVRIMKKNQGLLLGNNIFSGPEIQIHSKGAVKLEANLNKDLTANFADPAKGNLRLKKPHPEIVDKGKAFAEVSEDIDRRKRGAKPDIGAHEMP